MSRMPVLFIGHGSPMNAIEDNEFSRAWMQVGNELSRPAGILCISAHWETEVTWLTGADKPETIHDFYGFPPTLNAMTYPAPGSRALVERVQSLPGMDMVRVEPHRGLDHGAWCVLTRLFPRADVPVLQMSLDIRKTAREHYELGKALQDLRQEDILIIGSGNIVHNLRMIVFEDIAFDWAVDFDAKIKKWILEDNVDPILSYEKLGLNAELAINSGEHFKPIIYTLAARVPGETVSFFAERIWGGSISMRSVKFG